MFKKISNLFVLFVFLLVLILFSGCGSLNIKNDLNLNDSYNYSLNQTNISNLINSNYNSSNSSLEINNIKNKTIDEVKKKNETKLNSYYNNSNENLDNSSKDFKSNFSNSSEISFNDSLKNSSIYWYIPKQSISWQWQLTGDLNLNYNVDLYDIDLFETSKDEIDKLHKKGIKVICYFNAGAYEPYRVDSKEFPKEVLGNVSEGWEDERWLDISNYNKFEDIMKKRLDLAKEKGCDGVEPDNIDGYANKNGFGLTYEDQLEYNKWLAKEAHKRNLSIALKNDLNQVKDLEPFFDFAINEQCFYYDECDLLKPFIKNGKAVLNVEYELEKKDFCEKAKNLNFSSLKMSYDLDGGRDSC